MHSWIEICSVLEVMVFADFGYPVEVLWCYCSQRF